MRSTGAALFVLLAACGEEEADREADSCVPSYSLVTPDPQAVSEACHRGYDVLCERAFGDCAGQISNWESLSECEAQFDRQCSPEVFPEHVPDLDAAAECADAARAATCEDLDGLADPALYACLLVDLPVAPSPSGSETILPGNTRGEITGTEGKTYAGLPAVTYGICLEAGRTVTITLTPPASGDALEDPVLALVDASGSEIAFSDDDGMDEPYPQLDSLEITAGGPHLVVVSTRTGDDTGAFDMEVEVQ